MAYWGMAMSKKQQLWQTEDLPAAQAAVSAMYASVCTVPFESQCQVGLRSNNGHDCSLSQGAQFPR